MKLFFGLTTVILCLLIMSIVILNATEDALIPAMHLFTWLMISAAAYAILDRMDGDPN